MAKTACEYDLIASDLEKAKKSASKALYAESLTFSPFY
jgi:hypothetical protein